MKRLSTIWEDCEYNHFLRTVVNPGFAFKIFCDRCFKEIWDNDEYRHDRKIYIPGCAAIFAQERQRQIENKEHTMGENAGAHNIIENRKFEQEQRRQKEKRDAARLAEWKKRIVYPQKCKALTYSGSQCHCYPVNGTPYCDKHKSYKPENDYHLDKPRE